MMPISLLDIRTAYSNIKDQVQKTQVNLSHSGSQKLGVSLYFKYENEQTTGSFKIRGALNKILSLNEDERKRGVIASSAGNHAQGVALSASLAGVQAQVVMPKSSPLVKIEATRSYGAKVILHGEIYDEAYEHAKKLSEENGAVFVHPFEDDKIIAGQGTIALELEEQLKNLDSIVIPIGGGGLISGVATGLKALKPSLKVYGVVPENNPAMYYLFKGQQMSLAERKPTIADGLAVKRPSQKMFNDYIRPLVDDIAMVTEEEIAESIVFLLERAKTVVEGSGAVGLAGVLKMKDSWALGKSCCVLLCGGNIDLNKISKIIQKGLSESGRMARFRIVVEDRPGMLHRLTKTLAECETNVLQVSHDRFRSDLSLSQTQIEFQVETKSFNHIEEVKVRLREAGFLI